MFKKILSSALCLFMLLSTSISVFASGTQITNINKGETIISYGMDQGFVVIIPADFEIDSSNKAEAEVIAMNVMIADGTSLKVYVSGDDYNGRWELVDEAESANTLGYIIGSEEDGNDILNNGVVLSVNAGEAYDSTVIEKMYFKVVDTITKAGNYNDTLTFTLEIDDGIYSPAELERRYEFSYYSSLQTAVDNGTKDANKEDAVAGVYIDEFGTRNVVLMRDETLTETLSIDKYLVLNLGGHTLSKMDGTVIEVNSNAIIDGKVSGSKVLIEGSTGTEVTGIYFKSGDAEIRGGEYVSISDGAGTTKALTGTIHVADGATLDIHDAVIRASDDVGNASAAVCVDEGGELKAYNSSLLSESKNGYNVAGIANYGSIEMTDCSIIAHSDYLGNDAGTDYGKFSRGVYSYGSVTLNNCYVYGNHSGVGVINAPLTINGGRYEGYGHGGVYSNSGAGNITYIADAELIGLIYMPEGYEADEIVGNNYAGIYLGGTDTVTYMDNCYVYGAMQPIVLRDTREILYVSNTTTNTDYSKYPVRISNSSTLYIGEGNNFTKNQTSRPAGAIETGENYR